MGPQITVLKTRKALGPSSVSREAPEILSSWVAPAQGCAQFSANTRTGSRPPAETDRPSPSINSWGDSLAPACPSRDGLGTDWQSFASALDDCMTHWHHMLARAHGLSGLASMAVAARSRHPMLTSSRISLCAIRGRLCQARCVSLRGTARPIVSMPTTEATMPAAPKPLNELFSKLPTTIFSVMTDLANKHQSINLGQGAPNRLVGMHPAGIIVPCCDVSISGTA